MDTPKSKVSISSIENNPNKLITSSSSDSPAFQDSPVFKYISDLSPIQPVKADPGAHGFLGLASPPLVFASPRINSLTSLLNRKLHTSGSNSEFLQDSDKTQKNDGVPVGFSAFHSPLINEPKACNMKKLTPLACSSPSVCIDDFLTDPPDSANSSHKIQSDDAPQSSEGGCLEKINSCNDVDMHLNKSTLLPVKENAQAKSIIITRLVKNDARHLISSSECLGTLPRSFTDHTSEACQTGDSINEASNLERCTLRRCLFDENERKYLESSELWNPSDNLTTMQSNISSTRTVGDGEIKNLSKPATGICISSVDGTKNVTISKPLGIGLHLNSVVYPRSMNNSNISQQSFVARAEGENSEHVLRKQPDGNANACNVIGEVPAGIEERHQNNGCSVDTYGEVIASDVAKHVYKPLTVSNPNDHSDITYPKRKSSSELAECNDESNQVSPKNKRKKASNGSDENIKRCNCKKTKCLKLYCDCFAAGFYCAESCACQGCFNRPEYEDKVMETRHQIESRNPLAFAPKVVQTVSESPISNKEVGDLSTPSSARHKRGCNCKKSMCLKKYCECYQANVGCSEGCRCEGCKNVYGIREDCSMAREFMIRKTSDEMSEAIGSQDMSTIGSNFLNSRAHNSPSLMVATPALQCSDLRKNALKSRLPFRRFLQTADSHLDILTSEEKFLVNPGNSQSQDNLLEKSGEAIDIGASLDAEKCQENASDRVQCAGNEATSVSCSTQISNSAVYMIQSSSPKPSILGNTSPPHLFAETTLPSLNSSLRWRGSPVTPITQPVQDFVSGSKCSLMIEDDTPDILKDSSSPVKSVKVSSPNKKRISPPHNPADCSGFLNNPLKSVTVSSPNKKRVSSPHNPTDSSGNIKISRKFVLRAMPSFPSLTPYSKNSNKDNISESSEM